MAKGKKLIPGQRVIVVTPMWGLEAGMIGTLANVSKDRITGTFVPVCDGKTYILPLRHLEASTGDM